jgi:hypothetical protein
MERGIHSEEDSMKRLHRTLVAALAAACAGPALAAYFNVSEMVLGTHQADPTIASAPKIPCGSACKYASLIGTGMSNSYAITPATMITDNWSLPYVTGGNVRAPGTQFVNLEVAPPPDGVTFTSGAMGVAQRSKVIWDSTNSAIGPNVATVQTWKTGSGASVVSYGIRLTTPTGSGTPPTFLRFKVPERLRALQTTYYLQSYQYFYSSPDRAQSRAAMDVYVDGIPVWSSELNSLVPKRYHMTYSTQLELDWDQPLDGSEVTLFLGRLPAGSTRTLALVMRADLRVDGPASCRTYANNGSFQSCHSQREGMTLPGFDSGGQFYYVTPDVQVYTK